MTAVEALRAAQAAGVDITLHGDRLRLEAPSPPPQFVLDALRRNKAEIVTLLRRNSDCWASEGRQLSLDEQAGMAESSAGLPRLKDEMLAYSCCLFKLPNHNSLPGPHRDRPDCPTNHQAHDPLPPFRDKHDCDACPTP